MSKSAERITIAIIICIISGVFTFILSRATVVNTKADVIWVQEQDKALEKTLRDEDYKIRTEFKEGDKELEKRILDALDAQNEYLQQIIELKTGVKNYNSTNP
jgi:hypothetical protein